MRGLRVFITLFLFSSLWVSSVLWVPSVLAETDEKSGLFLPGLPQGGELSGYIAYEYRIFPSDALHSGQKDDSLSLVFQPEYNYEWDGGYQNFTFVPYLRLDQHDRERSHFDVRELYWLMARDDWELSVGSRRVFWGVTESLHLVDIINQTDLVENPDAEDKLGQPMVKFAYIQNWGTIDLYFLPYFRERTFPGERGRLRQSVVVDQDRPVYESGAEEWHPDWAVRYSHSFGMFDIGLSQFMGTARDARLELGTNPDGNAALIAHYDMIDQTSLDLQVTTGDWLWKAEALTQGGSAERYGAFAGGFEYTLVGVLDTVMDLGFLSEFLYDSRRDVSPSSFDNDLFIGLRLTANDTQSTEILTGVIGDVETGAFSYNLEAGRRIGDSWKVSLELRFSDHLANSDPLRDLRRDDYILVEVARYF